MKKLLRLLVLPSVFLFCTTSWAGNKNKCATLKKNAKKAQHLYVFNKKKAFHLKKRASVLKKDRKRMPANVRSAHKVINHEIHKLSEGKRKRLAISLKYLEKHIQFKKAAKRSCAKNRIKRKFDGQKLERLLSVASK